MRHPPPTALRRLILAAVFATGLSSCDRAAPPSPPTESATTAPSREATVYEMIDRGDTGAFTAWLSGNPDINQRGEGQTTPLIHAAMLGRAPMVRDLLARGADVTMVDLMGRAALHAAAREGHAEIARMLLEAGADPLAVDYDGLTSFDLASLNGHRTAAEVIADARYAGSGQTDGIGPTPAEPEIPAAVLLSTEFRWWTSASGDRIEAAYIQNIFDTVILQKRDGNMVRIAINRLAPEDQVTARQLSGIDPHALARARPNRMQAAARPPDSIADDIGDGKGWTVLADCRLLRGGGNDGDSFHVMHEGKEYIFRLYLVDAAETNDEFPDRVRDQARYFDLGEEETMRLGREAGKFTTSILASGPFTVYTRWEDARGNSRLPRFYALVSTPLGDLDELLTREGLVRQFGMPVGGSDGQRKLKRLRQLEQEAKQNKAGAWSREKVASNP